MVFSFTGRGQSNLDAQIDRSCNDSTIQDFKNNKIYYFGGAVIKYDDIEIQADYNNFNSGLSTKNDLLLHYSRHSGLDPLSPKCEDDSPGAKEIAGLRPQ